jgi:NADH-quinone oxidoreductase subunit L
MFLALGVGAWSAAIFHLMTHAFFKALLFLAAGSVILSLHHEQNIFAMGGLRKKIPLTFICFAIGCACLAALPLTSGFFSKDQILLQAWNRFHGFNWIWLAGIAGALITGIYSFRLLFLVFFGREGSASAHCEDANSRAMSLPLILLSLLALFGGVLAPQLHTVFGAASVAHPQLWVEGVAIAAPIVGAALAWWLFRRGISETIIEPRTAIGRWWLGGWGFDPLYHALLVKPFLWLAHSNRNDLIDSIYKGLAAGSRQLHLQFSASQTGQVRWYLTTLVAGAILFLAILVAL